MLREEVTEKVIWKKSHYKFYRCFMSLEFIGQVESGVVNLSKFTQLRLFVIVTPQTVRVYATEFTQLFVLV